MHRYRIGCLFFPPEKGKIAWRLGVPQHIRNLEAQLFFTASSEVRKFCSVLLYFIIEMITFLFLLQEEYCDPKTLERRVCDATNLFLIYEQDKRKLESQLSLELIRRLKCHNGKMDFKECVLSFTHVIQHNKQLKFKCLLNMIKMMTDMKKTAEGERQIILKY